MMNSTGKTGMDGRPGDIASVVRSKCVMAIVRGCCKIQFGLVVAVLSSVAVAETANLWSGTPVPRAAELERLEGVEFSVIKKHEPKADGYDWLHGVALCWHKGRLWASYGTNRGKENTPTEEAHVRVSDDGGKTWGPVQVVAKGGNGQGFSHGALASRDGVLWCFAAAISNKCANAPDGKCYSDNDCGGGRCHSNKCS